MKDEISGVGLLLFEPLGKLLVLQELQDKPHIKKKAGMLTFPLETALNAESYEKTLWRLMIEEMGVMLAIKPRKIGFFNFEHDTCKVRICMFVGHTHHMFIANPNDNDVAFHGWMFPNELLHVELKRVEVEPILHSYLNHP